MPTDFKEVNPRNSSPKPNEIFDLVAGGTMLAKTVFPVVNKMILDSMSISWQIAASPI